MKIQTISLCVILALSLILGGHWTVFPLQLTIALLAAYWRARVKRGQFHGHFLQRRYETVSELKALPTVLSKLRNAK